MKFAILNFAKFRDFGDLRKFLPAKVSAFKVEICANLSFARSITGSRQDVSRDRDPPDRALMTGLLPSWICPCMRKKILLTIFLWGDYLPSNEVHWDPSIADTIVFPKTCPRGGRYSEVDFNISISI